MNNEKQKCVFISNYYNHHQSSLSKAMYQLTDGKYSFIETMEMEEERKNMGWGVAEYPSYVLKSYLNNDEKETCQRLIDSADVAILGSAPNYIIKNRLKGKKLTFRYSERIFKSKLKLYELPARTILYYFRHSRHKNLYMLCASAYTAADYAKTATFLRKTYKWGYFTELIKHEDIDTLLSNKKPLSLLWAGRLIDLKRPDAAILTAKSLKDAGYNFTMNIIGNGEMYDELQKMIEEYNLCDNVKLLGSMTPNEVSKHMEESEIFLFTSDRNEGWGAVLNESMNAACAVVASHAIGSVPFLLENDKNGFIYKDGDVNDLFDKVKILLDDKLKRKQFGLAAYKTISKLWNADVAAQRFFNLVDEIQKNGSCDLYKTGPCSRAEILKDDWIYTQ